MFYKFCLFIWCIPLTGGLDTVKLDTALQESAPFDYALNTKLSVSSDDSSDLTILMHGFGGDHTIINLVRMQLQDKDHLVSFNFPDHWIVDDSYNPHKTTFGSIKELLPAIYIIKKCVVDADINKINLYGFSSGGGALVNVLAVLNSSLFFDEIAALGISKKDIKQMLAAIQSGRVILDCPLKSIKEVIDFRGSDPKLKVLEKRYRTNNLNPIDSLDDLLGLSLNLIVHFQTKDEILSNRDDIKFIDKLVLANQYGRTIVFFGNDGGHNSDHDTLWSTYCCI
jgi:hypothetical protein